METTYIMPNGDSVPLLDALVGSLKELVNVVTCTVIAARTFDNDGEFDPSLDDVDADDVQKIRADLLKLTLGYLELAHGSAATEVLGPRAHELMAAAPRDLWMRVEHALAGDGEDDDCACQNCVENEQFMIDDFEAKIQDASAPTNEDGSCAYCGGGHGRICPNTGL